MSSGDSAFRCGSGAGARFAERAARPAFLMVTCHSLHAHVRCASATLVTGRPVRSKLCCDSTSQAPGMVKRCEGLRDRMVMHVTNLPTAALIIKATRCQGSGHRAARPRSLRDRTTGPASRSRTLPLCPESSLT